MSDAYEGHFPLSADDMANLAKVIELVRDKLQNMSPASLKTTAAILVALTRFPATAAGVQATLSFVQPNIDGNYGWAEITVSESEFQLATGEHYYEPCVGGDTESRVLFQADAGADYSSGEIGDWLAMARVVAVECDLTIQDDCDYERIDWG